ncbi:MAG: hypothetical protein JJE13_09080 [Thermoleophilia bacterium]|nr:hypothetical protein [Thermoleophilia bacterium]
MYSSVGRPVEVQGNDVQSIPGVIVDYYLLWLQQLKDLGELAGTDIGTPPFSSLP